MFFLDKILRNVSIVVMVAFGAHEKTRIQLAGAIKLCASAGEKRHAEVREERGNSVSCKYMETFIVKTSVVKKFKTGVL